VTLTTAFASPARAAAMLLLLLVGSDNYAVTATA